MIFNDSDLFSKERPKTMSVSQSVDMYTQIAEEIKENGWANANSTKEQILSDLEEISIHDTGFEIAKELEKANKSCYYITTDFIAYLDLIGYKEEDIIANNVKQWVIAHNIVPNHQIGEVITLTKTIKKDLTAGSVWFIRNIYLDTARYVISKSLTSKSYHFISFEDIEPYIKKDN